MDVGISIDEPDFGSIGAFWLQWCFQKKRQFQYASVRRSVDYLFDKAESIIECSRYSAPGNKGKFVYLLVSPM